MALKRSAQEAFGSHQVAVFAKAAIARFDMIWTHQDWMRGSPTGDSAVSFGILEKIDERFLKRQRVAAAPGTTPSI